MASWLNDLPEHSAEALTARLNQTRDLAGPRQVGDTMGQGGWQHASTFRPSPPSPWVTFLPFLLLMIVAVGLAVTLIVLGAQS